MGGPTATSIKNDHRVGLDRQSFRSMGAAADSREEDFLGLNEAQLRGLDRTFDLKQQGEANIKQGRILYYAV
jgi:hypothetical protein